MSSLNVINIIKSCPIMVFKKYIFNEIFILNIK